MPKFNAGDEVYFVIGGTRSVTYTVLECIGTLGASYDTYRIQRTPDAPVTFGTDRDLHKAEYPETEIECCPGSWIPVPTNSYNTQCPVCRSVFTMTTAGS